LGAHHRSTKKISFSAGLVLTALLLSIWTLTSTQHASASSETNPVVPNPVPTQPTQLVTQSPVRTSTPAATSTHGVPSPGPTGVPTLCALSFSDVAQGDWFFPYVATLYCRGAISGYSDGTFRPYNNTTRGQLSKILVLAEAWRINTAGGPHFSDVPESNPFYSYIETAYNHGVISGYADGSFRWGNNVTRGQLSKIVVLAQNWPINTTGGPHFSDVPADSAFYTFVETAYNKGTISGYSDGTFSPGSNATRAQLAKIVQTALTTP
jgi:hypothetical protein